MAEHFTYRVSWSDEDKEHVGTCVEFPSLSHLDASPEAALRGIRELVEDVVADMRKSGERRWRGRTRENIAMSDPRNKTTPIYPVQTAMQEAVGDLPPDMQGFVVERVKRFLRALPSDGTPVPVTGARYDGGTTNYDPSILASYIGDWPL